MEKKRHTGGRTKGDGKGKTGGRQKGTPNKLTGELGEKVSYFIENDFDVFVDMMHKIVDPEKYVQYYLKALEFRLPKKAAVNVTTEGRQSDLRSEIQQMASEEID